MSRYWEELEPGSTVFDFRGEPHVFISIERRPSTGRDGKILTRPVDGGWVSSFYARVFQGMTWKLTEGATSGSSQ